eukprot:scaffold96625_cov69-Phaeocystis_antarctica.AAC.1
MAITMTGNLRSDLAVLWLYSLRLLTMSTYYDRQSPIRSRGDLRADLAVLWLYSLWLLTMATYYGYYYDRQSPIRSRGTMALLTVATYYGYLLWQAISEQISRYERAVQSAFNDVQRVQRQTQVGDAILVEDRSPYHGSTHHGYIHSIYFDSWSRTTLLTMFT